MTKPLSLLEFQTWFSDEESCARLLLERRWANGFICPKCGSANATSKPPTGTALPTFKWARLTSILGWKQRQESVLSQRVSGESQDGGTAADHQIIGLKVKAKDHL